MKRRKSFKTVEESQNFWPSFTDMISTIALILIFLIIIIFIKNIIIGKELKEANSTLMDTNKKLLSNNKKLMDKEEKIKQLNVEISTKEKNLMMLKEDVEKIQEEVEDGQLALQLSQSEIEKQKEIIANSNQELGNMRAKLQQIAVLRIDILNKVKVAIENELNSTNLSATNEVLIGDNGNIILNNHLMFSSNSYEIKSKGKQLLNELAVVFEKVLDDESIRENIDAINIEGHTDDVDTAEYNRDLSAKRSISVVNYLLSSNPVLGKKYGRYFVASAYSEYRPIAKGTSAEARAKNRRIEISIILKDSNIQKIIDNYLKQSKEVLKGN